MLSPKSRFSSPLYSNIETLCRPTGIENAAGAPDHDPGELGACLTGADRQKSCAHPAFCRDRAFKPSRRERSPGKARGRTPSPTPRRRRERKTGFDQLPAGGVVPGMPGLVVPGAPAAAAGSTGFSSAPPMMGASTPWSRSASKGPPHIPMGHGPL